MEDPLWSCWDSAKRLTREELELVLQKRKVTEVFNWFNEHFKLVTHAEYRARCPIVILQGPTGCGKTSTLSWISQELRIPIKEYSETTDTTAINFDLSRSISRDESESSSHLIDRRNALKFENFVVNSIRYNTLYAEDENSILPDDGGDSDFDSDDGFEEMISCLQPKASAPKRSQAPPPPNGVIIHIESPLSFSRTQRTFVQSMFKLLKIIKDISKNIPRRIAIVFETMENEGETMSVPSKMRVSLGLQVFKFNPVTRANMKKFVESIIKNYKQLIIDKETIEELINDCDGDIRACINTLQFVLRKTISNDLNGNIKPDNCSSNQIGLFHMPATKRQKLDKLHGKVRQVILEPSLLRDSTKSSSFFHVLGKIFYQKRLYPEKEHSHRHYRDLDRPYPTENSTEYLFDQLGIRPENLNAWLHQHYYRFCGNYNIEKASLFLENLSIVDTTALNSTQSSQFYEIHSVTDQIQCFLAIESTVFSLYQDQSKSKPKPSHKRVVCSDGSSFIIRSSVEDSGSTNKGELYSFNKPNSISLRKLKEDYQTLLDLCTARVVNTPSAHLDPSKILVDYVPYLSHISNNWLKMSPEARSIYGNDKTSSVLEEGSIPRIFSALDVGENDDAADYEARHEKLLELIEEIEVRQAEMATYSL